MGLAPEVQVLVINAVILAVAYLGIYPSMRTPTVARMLMADAVITALALLVAGALFIGTGAQFWTPFGPTNWALFTLITMLFMEMPLFTRFARRRRLPPFDRD